MLDINPHELFAEATLVSTTFVYGAAGLGKGLDPGSSDRDIPEGAQLDTPLWVHTRRKAYAACWHCEGGDA